MQETIDGLFNVYTASQLNAMGLILDETPIVSAVTGITYIFPNYFTPDGSTMLVPYIYQNPDGSFNQRNEWRYVIGNNPNPANNNTSDATLLISVRPQWQLTKFPPREDPKQMAGMPGLVAIPGNVLTQKYIMAPDWCVLGLISLETISGGMLARKPNDPPRFTTILADKMNVPSATPENPNAVAELSRNRSVSVGLVSQDLSNNPENYDNLLASGEFIQTHGSKFNLTSPSYPAGIPGANFLSNTPFRRAFLGMKTIAPTDKITAQIVGRPVCLDLISLFVRTSGAKPSIPEFVQAEGFAPPPTSGVAEGFTGTATTSTYTPYTATITLSDDIKKNVTKYLIEETCGISKTEPRIVGIVRQIRGTAPTYEKFQRKYLNLSTCAFLQPSGKGVKSKILDIIPGSVSANLPQGQPLALSIKNDSANLGKLIGVSTEVVEDTPENNQIVDAIFEFAKDLIFNVLSRSITVADEKPVVVTSSLLDRIPSGPVPINKTHIVTTGGFVIPTIPLAGVANVSIPMSDGKRCLPSLTTKKKSLTPI